MEKKNKRKTKGRPGTKTMEENLSRKVYFTLHAPEAKEVYLAGEFNRWDPQALPMVKREDGSWDAAIDLAVGLHEYKLFVDGVWTEDRRCEVFVEETFDSPWRESESVLNSFGTQNFAIRV